MVPELVVVTTGEELYMDYVLDGVMWTFQITIDRGIISTSGFNNDLVVKSNLHEVDRTSNLSYFLYVEYVSVVAMVI